MLRLVNFMLNPLLGISIVLAIGGRRWLGCLFNPHITEPAAMSLVADRPVCRHPIALDFHDTNIVARTQLIDDGRAIVAIDGRDRAEYGDEDAGVHDPCAFC